MGLNGQRKILYQLSAFGFFLWWGGFTFYAAFVVPTGMNVLGSHVLMGFITEQVSIKLNIVCAIAILFVLIYLRVNWKLMPRKSLRLILYNIVGMMVLLAALTVLHVYMKGLMDFGNRKLVDEPHFYLLHRIYLLVSTVMWIQGIIHIIMFLNLREL
jgi:hypothetical protein